MLEMPINLAYAVLSPRPRTSGDQRQPDSNLFATSFGKKKEKSGRKAVLTRRQLVEINGRQANQHGGIYVDSDKRLRNS